MWDAPQPYDDCEGFNDLLLYIRPAAGWQEREFKDTNFKEGDYVRYGAPISLIYSANNTYEEECGWYGCHQLTWKDFETDYLRVGIGTGPHRSSKTGVLMFFNAESLV